MPVSAAAASRTPAPVAVAAVTIDAAAEHASSSASSSTPVSIHSARRGTRCSSRSRHDELPVPGGEPPVHVADRIAGPVLADPQVLRPVPAARLGVGRGARREDARSTNGSGPSGTTRGSTSVARVRRRGVRRRSATPNGAAERRSPTRCAPAPATRGPHRPDLRTLPRPDRPDEDGHALEVVVIGQPHRRTPRPRFTIARSTMTRPLAAASAGAASSTPSPRSASNGTAIPATTVPRRSAASTKSQPACTFVPITNRMHGPEGQARRAPPQAHRSGPSCGVQRHGHGREQVLDRRRGRRPGRRGSSRSGARAPAPPAPSRRRGARGRAPARSRAPARTARARPRSGATRRARRPGAERVAVTRSTAYWMTASSTYTGADGAPAPRARPSDPSTASSSPSGWRSSCRFTTSAALLGSGSRPRPTARTGRADPPAAGRSRAGRSGSRSRSRRTASAAGA